MQKGDYAYIVLCVAAAATTVLPSTKTRGRPAVYPLVPTSEYTHPFDSSLTAVVGTGFWTLLPSVIAVVSSPPGLAYTAV
mgnify:CR=1 FL=1